MSGFQVAIEERHVQKWPNGVCPKCSYYLPFHSAWTDGKGTIVRMAIHSGADNCLPRPMSVPEFLRYLAGDEVHEEKGETG